MKKKNVLITGIGQANYIMQLYENIAPDLSSFNFNSINLQKFGNINLQNRANKIFRENYQFNFPSLNLIDLIKGFFVLFQKSYFWRDHFIFFIEKGFLEYLKSGMLLSRKHLHALSLAKYIDIKTNTDIIHLHFINHKYGLFINYLKKDYEIIFTYWGSDIYRIKNWKDHEIQKSILPKATIITAATPEMRFGIQTRFGFNLFDKLRVARFIHEKSFYNLAQDLMENRGWEKEFKKKMGIPQNKLILLYGHNSAEANNHLKFINCLAQLSEAHLKKFHIIFPLTYGNHDLNYIDEIKRQTKGIKTSFTFIEDFMEWEMIAKLKIVSNIYIHAPTTDGLSAFLTEYFYTNNLAIVAGWLPYKTFVRKGITYLEFNDFMELQNILENIKDYLSSYEVKIESNKDIVSSQFSIKKIKNEWLKIFKELEH